MMNLLKRFNMFKANSMFTPIECNWLDDLSVSNLCKKPYRETVGCLMFS